MPPTARPLPLFPAEPPQDQLPYGRWAHRLAEEFFAACLRIETEGDDELGELGDIVWYPDRTYCGRTYIPATARTSTDLEVYGHVSFLRGGEDEDPEDFSSWADYTAETADRNPDWRVDLCDDEIATWRAEEGRTATISLVWGTPIGAGAGAAAATAEVDDLVVDQCALSSERFTLVTADDYRADTLMVRIWGRDGREVAAESLYEPDE